MPCWRLAGELGFLDDDAFKWTPVGAADAEFRSGGKAVKIQCTTAYAERIDTIAKQGGHLRKLEMEESNASGIVWHGGAVTTPRTVDVNEEREAWRVGNGNANTKEAQARLSRVFAAHLRAAMQVRSRGRRRFPRRHHSGSRPGRTRPMGGNLRESVCPRFSARCVCRASEPCLKRHQTIDEFNQNAALVFAQ